MHFIRYACKFAIAQKRGISNNVLLKRNHKHETIKLLCYNGWKCFNTIKEIIQNIKRLHRKQLASTKVEHITELYCSSELYFPLDTQTKLNCLTE